VENKTVFDVNIWLSYFISGKIEQIVDMIEKNDGFVYYSGKIFSRIFAQFDLLNYICSGFCKITTKLQERSFAFPAFYRFYLHNIIHY
jgi:hypothetical protein